MLGSFAPSWRAGWVFQKDHPRAWVLWAVLSVLNWPYERLEAAFEDSHAPSPLTPSERKALAEQDVKTAPPWVRGNYPAWLHSSLERRWGESAQALGEALSQRAPVDVRINTLKTNPEKTLKALQQKWTGLSDFSPAPLTRTGLRFPPLPSERRAPHLEHFPAFLKGWFEVQDEGSQLAALALAAREHEQILDYCAGSGGKTLALAMQMKNKGQIYAFDAFPERMKNLWPRLKRAGVHNVQIKNPLENPDLHALKGRMHGVLADAPCTGSGVWRRHPDAKWRLTEQNLKQRQAEQDKILEETSRYVRPGGRLVYVTCSVLAEENEDRIEAFLKKHPAFTLSSVRDALESTGAVHDSALTLLRKEEKEKGMLSLSPLTTKTDGFFIAHLRRA